MLKTILRSSVCSLKYNLHIADVLVNEVALDEKVFHEMIETQMRVVDNIERRVKTVLDRVRDTRVFFTAQ